VTRLRVFLADDHPVVREGLKALINAQAGMEVVGEAADGQAALEAATKLRPVPAGRAVGRQGGAFMTYPSAGGSSPARRTDRPLKTSGGTT
jgi:hypothetical protein